MRETKKSRIAITGAAAVMASATILIDASGVLVAVLAGVPSVLMASG